MDFLSTDVQDVLKTNDNKFTMNMSSCSSISSTIIPYSGFLCVHWLRKLKILRGTGTKKLGLRGVTPSKTNLFWPICLLPVDNFATFLDFSFLFLIFLYYNNNYAGIYPRFMDHGSLKARQGSKYAAKPSKERRRKGDRNAVCDRQQAWADPLLFTKRPATLTCPGITLLLHRTTTYFSTSSEF